MRIFWHEDAAQELRTEIEWLDAQSQGLGARLRNSIRSALATLDELPHLGSPRTDGCRRFLLPDFPFDLVYLEEHDKIIVLALAHHRRRPGYWKTRRTGEPPTTVEPMDGN